MTGDLDADQAVRALAFRLRDWNVTDPGAKARAFIDDLTSHGWRCRQEEPRYHPPKKADECTTHAGNYRDHCRGCAADRKASA